MFLINDNELQTNIKNKIRVIDEDGNQIGLMSSAEALQLAESRKLDLVKIAPLATPPVYKIMNYGKFKFNQSKKLKESKKSQKVMSMKEIRLSLAINDHDLNTKIKNAIKFLSSGNKVKVSVRFKGREMLRTAHGHSLIEKVQQACADYGSLDKPGKLEGKNLNAIIVPKSKKQSANSNAAPKKVD